MTSFGTRRAQWIRIPEPGAKPPLAAAELAAFEAFDLFYRSLCALLYNYVPMSGHPGGSISSGRFVAGLLFDAAGLRARAARPGGRRHRLLRRRPQGDGPLRDLGAARRDRARRATRRCSPPTMKRAPAPRGPPRLPPQPDHRDAALREAPGRRRSTATRRRRRRSCGSRPAPRASGSRARSASPSAARDDYGADAPARPHRRGRGRPHAGPRRRGAGRGRRPPRSTTSSSTWTGTRPRSTRTACAATATRRATTCSGPRWSSSTCTTGTSSRSPDGSDFQQVIAAQRRPSRSTTASRPRSSTAR